MVDMVKVVKIESNKFIRKIKVAVMCQLEGVDILLQAKDCRSQIFPYLTAIKTKPFQVNCKAMLHFRLSFKSSPFRFHINSFNPISL